MEVYKSPLHSLMTGELFQSGLLFDAYIISANISTDANLRMHSWYSWRESRLKKKAGLDNVAVIPDFPFEYHLNNRKPGYNLRDRLKPLGSNPNSAHIPS